MSDTAESKLFALSARLARPVALGQMSLTTADITLLNAADTAIRSRRMDRDLVRFTGYLQHVLRLNLAPLETRRAVVRARIKRVVAPLIAARAQSRRLLAEAHNTNGEAGFPLAEAEVTEIVRVEVFWATRRRRYAA